MGCAVHVCIPAGAMKVAVVGYITAEAKTSVKAELTAGLRFGEGALAIHDVLAEVRALRPDLTVLLAHAGGSCDGPVCTGEAIRLADAVESRTVDLLMGGHTHRLVNTRVAGVSIVEAGPEGSSVAVADMVKTSAGGAKSGPGSSRSAPTGSSRIRRWRHWWRATAGGPTRSPAVWSRPSRLPSAGPTTQQRLGGLIAEARRNVLRADVGLVGERRGPGRSSRRPGHLRPAVRDPALAEQPGEGDADRQAAPRGAGACAGPRRPGRRPTSPGPGSATTLGVVRDSGCRASSFRGTEAAVGARVHARGGRLPGIRWRGLPAC